VEAPEAHALYNRKGDNATTETDLSRTDGWSRYIIPFETLMPKGITKYMSDRD